MRMGVGCWEGPQAGGPCAHAATPARSDSGCSLGLESDGAASHNQPCMAALGKLHHRMAGCAAMPHPQRSSGSDDPFHRPACIPRPQQREAQTKHPAHGCPVTPPSHEQLQGSCALTWCIMRTTRASPPGRRCRQREPDRPRVSLAVAVAVAAAAAAPPLLQHAKRKCSSSSGRSAAAVERAPLAASARTASG